MDGIFGVGLGEIVVIAIIMLIVGGPRNTAKWAREAGRMAAKARAYLSTLMKDFENELGDDGKEILNTARELGSGVNEVRQTANPKRLVSQADKFLKDSVEPTKSTTPKSEIPESEKTVEPINDQYAAWAKKSGETKEADS